LFFWIFAVKGQTGLT